MVKKPGELRILNGERPDAALIITKLISLNN